MTNYYIELDGKIELYDTSKTQLQNTLIFTPQYKDLEILESEREIIERNGVFVFADEIQEELFQEAKEAKISEINEAKEQAFKEGIIFNGAHFDCDDRAQDRTGNRLLLLQAMPVETLEWLDFDYKPVEMTDIEFQELCAAIFERVQFIEFKTGQLFDAVDAALSIEDVDSIEIDFTQKEETESGETNE